MKQLHWFTASNVKTRAEKLFILKTNINNPREFEKVRDVLELHPDLQEISIDLEDVDRVLRMEVTGKVQEFEVIKIVNELGFQCKDLD